MTKEPSQPSGPPPHPPPPTGPQSARPGSDDKPPRFPRPTMEAITGSSPPQAHKLNPKPR